MRRPFTTAQARANGITPGALRHGNYRRILQGVYVEGSEPPTRVEKALALLTVTNGVASGALAGTLLELDSISLTGKLVTVPTSGSNQRAGVRRRDLAPERIVVVDDYRCTDGLQTLLDIAPITNDFVFEQTLESVLRKGLATVEALNNAIAPGVHGSKRIRRVLSARPIGAPPTESLLETLFEQMTRLDPTIPRPLRQVVIVDQYGAFVARVDFAWPHLGIFIELDGQHHEGQPVYDASRQTRVVACTGWLPARFTWHEVKRTPKSTLRRLHQLLDVSSALSVANQRVSSF